MHELKEHMIRRRLGGWDEVDPKYNYGDMRFVISKAKMMQSITIREDTGSRYYRWVENRYPSWTSRESDWIGSSLRPFGGNNYLYGFPIEAGPLEAYRTFHDPDHPNHALWVKERERTYDRMAKERLNPGVVADILAFAVLTQDPNIYLIGSTNEEVLDLEGRVFVLHKYFDWQARFLTHATASSYYLFPGLVLAQLYTLGWKRTLLTWGVGILATEGISATQDGRLAGWSVITYMIYGQFWEEIYRLRQGFFKPKGFVTNSVGIWGLYVAGESFLKDSAPFLSPGPKTGVHHGAHHIGLILGFLLNRWSH